MKGGGVCKGGRRGGVRKRGIEGDASLSIRLSDLHIEIALFFVAARSLTLLYDSLSG